MQTSNSISISRPSVRPALVPALPVRHLAGVAVCLTFLCLLARFASSDVPVWLAARLAIACAVTGLLPGALILLADRPPIRNADWIDHALGFALRTRESLHARGFRFGEVQP